jgi:FixJ family two-component response regulator
MKLVQTQVAVPTWLTELEPTWAWAQKQPEWEKALSEEIDRRVARLTEREVREVLATVVQMTAEEIARA